MTSKYKYQFETLAIHAGYTPDPVTRASTVPIYQTVAYTFQDAAQAARLFQLEAPDFPGEIYSRFTNPTCEVLEKRIAALEGGRGTVAFASGQAAVTAAFLPLVSPGDNIVSSSTIYGGTYTLFDLVFPAKFSVKVKFVNPGSPENFQRALDHRTRALFVETIGNPLLNVPDLEALAQIAHAAGIPLVVDNTFATPYLCRPGAWGADLVVHSATKWLGGHGTSLGGIVVDTGNFPWEESKFPELTTPDPAYRGGLNYGAEFGREAYLAKLKSRYLRDLGPCLSPFNAFLILLGVETLPLRMERHSKNALEVAQFLSTHPQVSWVSYPGLPSSPTYRWARKYLVSGAGGMVGFGIKGGLAAGKKFIESLKLFSHLANVGDAKSLAIHPASTTQSQLTLTQQEASGVAPDYIRLSVGLESVSDLLADLGGALEKARLA